MMTGILNMDADSHLYLTDEESNMHVHIKSGQYLYLSVHECWVPVKICYNEATHRWFFRNLEDINVTGQCVMMKK